MTPQEFVQWLKENSLFHVAERHYPVFESLLTKSLGLRKEYLLIIGDYGYEDRRASAIMTGCYLLAAKRLGLKYSLVVQEPKKIHSTEDDPLVKALSEFNECNALAIAISGKLSSAKVLGKSFRRYAKSQAHKFATTVSLQELTTKQFGALVAAIDVDYGEMQRRASLIKQKLDNGNTVRVTSPAGTDVTIDISRKYAVANTANYDEPRSGGNIPAGEVYIAPNGKGVDGRVVIDGSAKIKDQTILVREPIVLDVSRGEITSIKGGEEAELLEKTLCAAEKKNPAGTRRIGELGIGINPNAKIMGPNLINEKTLGTAHIAIGSNEWFGGSVYSSTHLDQVFRNPTIYIDDERLRI
ncbi:MAG: aminopeptidase [Candidatus Woesearchaeota archaeon]